MIDSKEAASALGKLGGPARAAAMSPEQRKEQARKAARARWAKMTPDERKEAAAKMRRGRKK